ncbi:unnamed protein product, partial [Candidula unifasciata]
MNLRKTSIFKVISSGSRDKILKVSRKYIKSGKNPNLRDPQTGGNILHHIAIHCHKFIDPEMLTVVYMLACANVEVDAQDHNGDTALHHVVRQRGAYRLLVALIRCGADTSIQNSAMMTAEDILQLDRPPGHEEMLHWYNKFKPGLWCALQEDKPDRKLIEKLLKSWCRLTTVKNGQLINMKARLQYDMKMMSLLKLAETYESSVNLAIALLGGQGDLVRKWIQEGLLINYDVNITDHSYQFRYPDYPEVPQCLLEATWATNCYSAVDALMDLQVNPCVLCPCAENATPLPAVFQLFSGPSRPKDLRIIHRILQHTDVSVKNYLGQTLLFQSVSSEESCDTVDFLLRQGVSISARDKLGRTARDFAQTLGRKKYIQAIDGHVIKLIKVNNFSQIEELVLGNYDHIDDITDRVGRPAIKIAKNASSKQVYELVQLRSAIQSFVKRVFRAVDEGCYEEVGKLLTCKKYAAGRDLCGRTPLLKAVLQGRRSLVTKLVSDCQFTINMQDNLGRSVLHYATLFIDDPDMLQLLRNHGANPALTDVLVWIFQGPGSYIIIKIEIQDADLDIYTFRTNFETSFREALQAANLDMVKQLITGLAENGDVNKYSHLLFECVDLCREDIAIYMILAGFRVDIWKSYSRSEASINTSSAKTDYEPYWISLKQRATETGCSRV